MKEYSRLHCSHIHTFVRIFFSQLRPFICNTRVVCGWKKVEIEADWNILNRIYHWQYICILYTVHKNDVYYVIHLILNARQIMDVGNRLADLIWLEVSVAWVAAKEGKQHIILFICCYRVPFWHLSWCFLLFASPRCGLLWIVCLQTYLVGYLLHHSKRNEIRRNPTLNGVVSAFSISIFTKSK